MDQELQAAMDAGTPVLTATRRLSRHLRLAHGEAMQQSGKSVWATPEVLPLSAWIAKTCEEALEAGVMPPGRESGHTTIVLSPSQEAWVWEQIIADDPTAGNLLRPSAAAQSAAEAWRILQEARTTPPEPSGSSGQSKQPSDSSEITDSAPSEDTATEDTTFLRWQTLFQERCVQAGWLTQSELAGVLEAWIEQRQVGVPRSLVLAGFDDFTPSVSRLLSALKKAGCDWQKHEPSRQEAPSIQRVVLEDTRAEIEAAARWARALLEQSAESDGGASISPRQPVAIVLPDLTGWRAEIERTFTTVLSPNHILPGEKPAPLFHISQGVPLSGIPMVADGLLILQAVAGPLSFDLMGWLIRSPWIGGASTESQSRAKLEARLRRKLGHTVSLSSAARYAAARNTSTSPGATPSASSDNSAESACPLLAERMASLQEKGTEVLHQKLPLSDWARVFGQILRAAGWPGDGPLDSHSWQTKESFRNLFSELAAMDRISGLVGYHESLARLTRLAGEAIFQPEAEPAPVQIMGLLEAGGLNFSHLWALGLHDEAWPRAPHPNPFLPAPWQREQQLPRSNAAREAEQAAIITKRLLASAENVVLSSPESAGEQTLRPSPLIADRPQTPVIDLKIWPGELPFELARNSGTREGLVDVAAPPLAEGSTVGGGVSLFRDQAACPFRAFANHRLHARGLESPAFGLDASQRGEMIHQALQKLWEELKSQNELKEQINSGTLPELLSRIAEETVAEIAEYNPQELSPRLAGLEKIRIAELMQETLVYELERMPFTVVEWEADRKLEIGGIEVSTRIDRADFVDGIGTVLIDYKSTAPKETDWFGDRPDDPQMPLYGLMDKDPPAALVFLQLKKGESLFRGLEATTGVIPNVKRFDELPIPPDKKNLSREEMLDQWRQAMVGLAQAFRNGDARVDPKKPPATCSYCDLGILCRVNEQERVIDPDETEDGTEGGNHGG